jgi:hypothetical protein
LICQLTPDCSPSFPGAELANEFAGRQNVTLMAFIGCFLDRLGVRHPRSETVSST